MQSVVDGCLRPANAETGARELISELLPIESRIRDALNAKAAEMQTILRQANPRLLRVEVSPVIDFARSVTATSLMIDTGDGLRSVENYGEGSKKRLWMGLIEWERRAQRQASAASIVRVFDEPDVNLDYAAEPQLFGTILDAALSPGSRTQAIVCTHAMTLVDRAPISAINLLQVSQNGHRTVEHVRGDADDDIREFAANLGRSVGLTNSAFFYEKAFLVVEGESEENAIPIIYRNLYNWSLFEDGIVLVNLHSCSAWKGLLKVLLSHRSASTVMLLDQDCTMPNSSGYVTSASLSEIGYPTEFLRTACFYVGTKEFEDAFVTEDMVSVLNRHWAKPSGATWNSEDVESCRLAEKFSVDLLRKVRETCEPSLRQSARKPGFAARLAEQCRTMEQVPATIRNAIAAVRRRAGIDVEQTI
jgi:hypothetical protein